MFNMGFLLVSMQLAKKIDWEDPNVLNYARIGYYGAQILVVAMAYGLITLIKKKNGKFSVRVLWRGVQYEDCCTRECVRMWHGRPLESQGINLKKRTQFLGKLIHSFLQ